MLYVVYFSCQCWSTVSGPNYLHTCTRSSHCNLIYIFIVTTLWIIIYTFSALSWQDAAESSCRNLVRWPWLLMSRSRIKLWRSACTQEHIYKQFLTHEWAVYVCKQSNKHFIWLHFCYHPLTFYYRWTEVKIVNKHRIQQLQYSE